MKIAQRDINKPLGWFVITFILALLVSCSSNLEKAIIGKWSEIDGTEKIEFFDDGTLTVADEEMNMGGSYKFVEKDRIRVELGGLGALAGPFVAKVSVSGNELTLTMPDGEVGRYRRVK
ncbi:MAG: hypothetical protein AB1507_05000 [Bacillota bacterium]|nr:hypothetical protein [Thermoanaerobacteraceae bacterium]